MKDSDQSSNKSETNKQKLKLETQTKITKKLLEEATKSGFEKDEKITSLKATISKLEEHIIKQVKNQGLKGNDYNPDAENVKAINNDPAIMLKSEAL